MTSIAARLTRAEGAYRSPRENGATFLLLNNVRFAGDSLRVNRAGDTRRWSRGVASAGGTGGPGGE
jgi:hypothetical protein